MLYGLETWQEFPKIHPCKINTQTQVKFQPSGIAAVVGADPNKRLEIYCPPTDCGFPDSPVCVLINGSLLIDLRFDQADMRGKKM